jgi:glycosyltransferase involved in cell wall biosynthesis
MTAEILPVSVVVIAKDEAAFIGDAIRSVQPWAAEVVVLVDRRSRDETATVARQLGAVVFEEHWLGFPAQRNLALLRAQQPWVFFLDADERCESALHAELTELFVTQRISEHAGWWVPRHNVFFGRVLRGGGWYPDYQLRVVRRGSAHYDERIEVHEVAEVAGSTAQLKGHITHLNIVTFGELWQKQAAYARREATTMYRAGRKVRLRNYVGAPVREFIYRYIRNQGWRDGWVGLMLACVMAWFALQSFVWLGQMRTEPVQGAPS